MSYTMQRAHAVILLDRGRVSFRGISPGYQSVVSRMLYLGVSRRVYSWFGVVAIYLFSLQYSIDLPIGQEAT